MFKLAFYLKLYKKEIIIGPAAKLTEAVFEILVPVIVAGIIDKGIGQNDKAYILKMGGVLLLLSFLGLCFALVCQYLASRTSQGIGTAMRNDIFKHINSLSAAEIDKIGVSSLITRINSDVNQLQLCVAMLIRLVIRAPFLIIGSTVAAMLIDLKLSVIFLITGPVLGFILYEIMKRSAPFFREIQKRTDRLSLITKEGLAGARVIRAFSKEKYEEKRFKDSAEELSDISVSVGKISALLNPLTFLVMNIAVIFIIYFGGIRVNTGEFTQGEVIAFINYITQIMLAMVALANVIVIFTKGSASAARVNEIFSLSPSVKDSDKTFIPDMSKPLIEFKNVSFSYNKSSDKTLEGVSFCVNKGEKVGIIGGTGSGKTTVGRLISRSYDADSGEIFFCGTPIKDIPFSELRNNIRTVYQKSVLFYGSLRDNFRVASENLSDEEIYAAIDAAQAREFTDELPNGLSSVIERGGENLSGGQKQRLCIARAAVSKPSVLILDDSTSALDFATEAGLRKTLFEYLPDTAIITLTQRVSCVMKCDKIIVIDDGKLISSGTHDELYEQCDIYREICLSQLKEREVMP